MGSDGVDVSEGVVRKVLYGINIFKCGIDIVGINDFDILNGVTIVGDPFNIINNLIAVKYESVTAVAVSTGIGRVAARSAVCARCLGFPEAMPLCP